MTVIRDRRDEPPNDKFGTDKERFRARYLDRIRKAMHEKIAAQGMADIGIGGIRVPIPKETTHEPIFHHSGGDPQEKVYPGNKLDVGDRIFKPKSGGGGGRGNEASEDDSDAEDDFIWINEEDYLKILFDGRSLPDMTKLKEHNTTVVERQHSGYTDKGPDHRLDSDKTDKNRRDDSMILAKGTEKRILENLTEQFNILSGHAGGIAAIDLKSKTKSEKRAAIKAAIENLNARGINLPVQQAASDNDGVTISLLQKGITALNCTERTKVTKEEEHRLSVLEARLQEQFRGRSRIGKLRDEHLVFEYDEDVPKPNAKAVMFCIMDVSGSMDQEYKNTAKVFFWLLNKFLKEKYKQVDIVFIAHTTRAFEVDEKTFFYGQETGGTIVSTCLEKTMEIIEKRYPASEWNIYSAQASDGDNAYDDNIRVENRMKELLPLIQAHYYVEVGKAPGYMSDLFLTYETMASQLSHKIHTANGVNTPARAMQAFLDFFPVGGAKAGASPNPSFG